MAGYKRISISNGNILVLLLILTVASQFDGASFEGSAKVVMYILWGIIFIIYSFALGYIDRTRYILNGIIAVGMLVMQYIIAGMIVDNYHPPIVVPFITSFLFYISGILFYRMGLDSRNLQKALRAYCIMCIFLGIYIWTTYYGSLVNWFTIDQNLYYKKNSAGQILAIGAIISFFYIKSESLFAKIVNIAIGIGLAFIIMIIHCRTALLALCIAITVHLFLVAGRKKKIILTISLLIVALIVFNIPFLNELISQALYIDKYMNTGEFTLNAFLSNRLDWFTAAYDRFSQSMVTVLLGVGRSYVDNLFINVLTSSGLIGILIVFVLYLDRFMINFKLTSIHNEYILLKIMSIFYIIESFAEGLPPYGPGACSVIFWFICGYCDVMNRRKT